MVRQINTAIASEDHAVLEIFVSAVRVKLDVKDQHKIAKIIRLYGVPTDVSKVFHDNNHQ